MQKVVIVFLLLLIPAVVMAGERTVIYPTFPGTNVPDRSSPERYVIEDGVAYPAHPYTSVPDRTSDLPRYKIGEHGTDSHRDSHDRDYDRRYGDDE